MIHTNISTNAVKAVIFDHEHKVLLLQRSPKPGDVANWDLPGGLVDEGEDEKSALVRELKEELSVDAHIISKSHDWNFIRPKDKKNISVQNYICRIHGDIKLSHEHQKFIWVDPHELRRYPVKDESLYSAVEKLKR